MLLHDIVTEGARTRPQETALIFGDFPQTFAQVADIVNTLSAGFETMGIQPGDKVGLLLPNCLPFVWAYYAASQIGAIVVPVNPQLKAAELEYIWRDANVKLVMTVSPLLPVVQAARANLPNLLHIITVTPQKHLPESERAAISGLAFLDNVLAAGQTREKEKRRKGEEEIRDTRYEIQEGENSSFILHPSSFADTCAVIIYTSGTTGHPKGAMLSHRNLTRNVEQIQARLQFVPGDRFVTVLPLFHAFAATVCLNTCLAAGCASILLENFAPVRTLEVIAQHNATIFPAVPAIFNAVLNVPADQSPDTSSLRVLVSGGAPLPAPTLARLEARFGVPVLEGDGPTECSPVTSVNPLDGPRKVGSVGPALPDVEIAIFDEQDKPLPINEIGEIVVRGDNVMLGYLNQPEATQEAMQSGWYHTGDLGTIDEDGYVFIVDRKKDMIITAGLNVYPREIEDVLLSHPGVADVAVIGTPDALRGEDVLAVVVLRADLDTPLLKSDLIRYCRERLANYKAPRQILIRDTLPRGGTGKVVKRLLKKELELESNQ